MEDRMHRKQVNIGTYAGRSFVIVGVIGGCLASFILSELKARSSPGSALRGEFQEAPIWIPGVMMMLGPIIGVFCWLLLKGFRRS